VGPVRVRAFFANTIEVPIMGAAPDGSVWQLLTTGVPNGANVLTASIVLAIMILPYMARFCASSS